MSVLASSNGPKDLVGENAPWISSDQIREKFQTVEQTVMPQDPSQWRPSFHLTAPHGWLNDPCGLGYDPETRLYHLAFQWNPSGNDWGNISWGHSVSSDLVHWETSPHPSLTPGTDYDRCGVFTGCLRPSNVNGESGALTYIYTSVGHLPIHYALPYTPGSETLSMAVSHNGGATWKRQDCNPILPGPPSGIKVTGWRDPYVGAWPSMQHKHASELYGFISGGIAGKAPTLFVYTVNSKDLKEWKYIGSLIDVGFNFHPSRWSGDFGMNWEVSTLTTLTDASDSVSRDFVIMGTEGCLSRSSEQKRVPRGQLWMCVKPRSTESQSEPLTTYQYAGIFDHGCLYAANSFWDPVTSQQIVYGWITEEDLSDPLRHRQGWSGLISLPRVVNLMTLHNVTKARRSALKDITSIETEADDHGTYTVRTLGIHPDQRLEKLRKSAQNTKLANLQLQPLAPHGNILPLRTSKWELDAEFAVSEKCAQVGIAIGHGDSNTHTTLSYTPTTETFTITRPQTTGTNHSPETAPHTLFTFDGRKEETLRVRAFFDHSVLEVFVNERTVISTRIYTEGCSGLRFFAESESQADLGSQAAVLVRADVWDGLG